MCVLGGGRGGGPYNHSFINQILSIYWVSDIYFPRNTSVEKYKTCCSRGAYILLGGKQIKETCKAYRRPEGQNGTGRQGDWETGNLQRMATEATRWHLSKILNVWEQALWSLAGGLAKAGVLLARIPGQLLPSPSHARPSAAGKALAFTLS